MNWRPADEVLAELGQRVVADNPGVAIEFKVEFGEVTVLADKNNIVELLRNLRDNPAFRFQQLMLLSGADYPHRGERFDVVYHLMSLTKNQRIRVTVRTDEDTPVPTVTSVYPNADWYEREAFDMYGIFFSGHPDLRRILTDYGFHGYPLRKDFPMSGYVEVRYDDEAKRVVYEPIKITEWRNWDFLSPWEGAEYARPGEGYAYKLPGDEKGEAK